MKITKEICAILVLALSFISTNAQTYPSYGPEKDVTINGLSFDAMEPFISPDGKYLFFNNLNDGINTRLYLANWVNDSTFNLVGELNGANQPTPPHLDAVADLDSLNNFYWTSTRNYPTELDNLFYGKFNAGSVSNIGRLRGDFNKNTPGWLVMDHGISIDGQFLYFNNARFDNANCQGPCETEIGIAQKVNDSTFATLSNSQSILQTINDTSFKFYAPCISSDDLELYYTRYPAGTLTSASLFEICVAVRTSPTDNFSIPKVLFSDPIGDLIEAPTLTVDKQIMYYHRKIPGSHKIVFRNRRNFTGISKELKEIEGVSISPNPVSNVLNLSIKQSENFVVTIYNMQGSQIIQLQNTHTIETDSFENGLYLLIVSFNGKTYTKRFIVKH